MFLNMSTGEICSTKDESNFEEDVIFATPEKCKVFKHKKKLKNRKPIQISYDDSIKHTFLISKSISCLTENKNCTLHNKFGNRLANSYTFVELSDVVNCPEKLADVKIKLIGVYQQTTTNNHYLLDHRNTDKNNSTLLDFKLLNQLPKPDETIEVFGNVALESVSMHSRVVIVQFWNLACGNINRYICNLLKLQSLFPIQAATDSCDSFNQSSCSNISDDFEEIDESCLFRNMDSIESNLYEFNEIMNIDYDIFL